MLTSLELCAGAGGQALGLESAGFNHLALVELDPHACETLRKNRPEWNVVQENLDNFNPSEFLGVDLLSAGLPCPPFSKAGRQLGQADERNLFPAAFRIIEEVNPRAVLIENVKGLLDKVFDSYRAEIEENFLRLGFLPSWHLVNAKDFGVSQLRPRVVCIALREPCNFDLAPQKLDRPVPTVGEMLEDLMGEENWTGLSQWREQASGIAPTLVGGSKKHGGADLGPTRSKMAWQKLGVDGGGIANSPPSLNFVGNPKLTLRMVARLQGFPDSWTFAGKKTAQYRQIGNAFPPPVAEAIGRALASSLRTQPKIAATA